MARKINKQTEELTGHDDVRLARELEDTYRQLFTLRLQVATRQLQNVREVRKTKRRVARIKTLQRQRELSVPAAGRAGGGR